MLSHGHNCLVLSYIQVEPLLKIVPEEGFIDCEVSLDLNLSLKKCKLSRMGLHLPDGPVLSLEQLKTIAKQKRQCFTVTEGEINPISVFSPHSNKMLALCPTLLAPTMLVSGIPMHRIKGIDPYTDTLSKIKAISPVKGNVLDTATGLGYTAIEAAKHADTVLTIEKDPSAIWLAHLNPWSRQLFENPIIQRVEGDVTEVIKKLPEGNYSRVIHDPPTFKFAGEMYSLAFYTQLRRVLATKGLLFHYIGDPESKLGAKMTMGVIRRLKEAGFRKVIKHPEAFGVVAS